MTHRELIENFYETIKDKYPNLTLDDIGRICCSPFHFANRAITRNILPIIRFKYLGTFCVKRNRAINAINKLHSVFNSKKYVLKKNRLSEESYLRELAKLNKVVNRPEDSPKSKPDVEIDDDL